MSTYLETSDLCVDFPIKGGLLQRTIGYVHAVQNVNLVLNQGDSLGLVGESGSGKSTLGLALLGLNRLSRGKIILQGQELKAADFQNLRKKMQIVFQDSNTSLNPKRTIGQHLADPLRHHQIVDAQNIKDRSAQLLKQVGLDPEMLDRYPHAFSGGQRQRINIARALASEPEFLVCDEVTSALDVRTQAQVLDLLAELKQNLQLTMVFISHDLAVVQHLCTDLMVMQNGKVIESGPAGQVFHSPTMEYTRQLIEAVPRLRRA